VNRDIARYIDHTLLKPEATETMVRQLCREAAQFRFATVCVNPTWVELCARLLKGAGVGVCTVAGFPLGAVSGEVKAYEARRAVMDGADEVDMVVNIGRLKSGQDAIILDEIRRVADVVHGASAGLKVIVEAALLTDEEKIRACLLAKEASADYVKTSTGFGPGGATLHDVVLMRQAVGDGIGVKAAGGIRDLTAVRQMLEAGATRIGTSAGVKIIQELHLEEP
jgi:deoxyribose-phosphate aldolase